jgi:hypothetical protein
MEIKANCWRSKKLFFWKDFRSIMTSNIFRLDKIIGRLDDEEGCLDIAWNLLARTLGEMNYGNS